MFADQWVLGGWRCQNNHRDFPAGLELSSMSPFTLRAAPVLQSRDSFKQRVRDLRAFIHQTLQARACCHPTLAPVHPAQDDSVLTMSSAMCDSQVLLRVLQEVASIVPFYLWLCGLCMKLPAEPFWDKLQKCWQQMRRFSAFFQQALLDPTLGPACRESA